MKRGAAQQGDEPVEALELKIPLDGTCVIDVRFAGYRQCSADIAHGDELTDRHARRAFC
jgi:hypothetical protein